MKVKQIIFKLYTIICPKCGKLHDKDGKRFNKHEIIKCECGELLEVNN